MKRFLIACVVLLSALPALAQKTPAPFVLQQYFDGNGDPYSSAGMCVFAAGTSTLASSYTTSAGITANANPLMMDSAGRPSSNGFFLTSGVSYKLTFVNFTGVSVPSCSPINGVSVWSQDAIMATPASSGFIEISTATAGEAISAGDAAYLSDGNGSRTAGRWYRTDADFAYASSEAPIVGVATAAISSGSTGTIVISGLITLSGPFTPGVAYFASATAGAITSSIPTIPRVLGTAQTTTAFLVSPFNVYRVPNLSSSNILNAIQLNSLACGRLTLTTGDPYPTTDVTNGTTVYYTPAGQCNQIALYTGGASWAARTFTQLSIAVPATTATNYDVFAYDNNGVTLELSAAWSSATAIFGSGTYQTTRPTQDGVWVKSTNGTTIDATRRYLGSFRTTSVSGQTSDSVLARYVYNAANQTERPMWVQDATVSQAYTTTTWRQARGTAGNKVEFLIGLGGKQTVPATVRGHWSNSVGGLCAVGIGIDSITAPATASVTGRVDSNGVNSGATASYNLWPAIGYHYAAWLEIGCAGGSFEYTNGAAISGLVASIRQ